MNLDETQKQTVTRWIHDGLKLSEIQSRLMTEMNLNLTYIEVRFLVDDLKLTPKDPEPPTPPPPLAKLNEPTTAPAAPEEGLMDKDLIEKEPEPGKAGVSVSVDKIAVPGSLVSGAVTFSDGMQAQWYLDEMGRLGIAAKEKGYRPAPADVQAFQSALQRELAKLGL